MESKEKLRPLLVICGPTGSGKSALSIYLAAAYGGEIINCDSLQVYRHFDLGTAKVTPAERRSIPHHLIDVVEPTKSFTAGDYQRLARNAVCEVSARGALPIVTGGTGFYLRALLVGLSPIPPRDETLRARLSTRERRKPGSLHRLLTRLDSPASARIHAHDLPKTIRALEIRMLAGYGVSHAPRPGALEGFNALKLALIPPRAALYERLDQRAEEMFAGGLLNEVEHILNLRVPKSAKPFESLGYAQAIAFLEGKLTREEALAEMRQRTRQYAKRQITWFRHEPGARIISGFGEEPAVQSEAERLLGEHRSTCID